MIELITGLPGNAKTLHAIGYVKAWAERESRPVFYSGIKDCKVPGWVELDPVKWMDCPQGSIIFIDEAQKTFRNRSIGSNPPLHVTELEEHRHRGVDFVMITQHPSLVDPAVRKLTQTHKHLVRIFGMEASTVHKWTAVKDNPEKPASRRDSEKTKWVFDKSLYSLYHSADQHTFKRQIPMRLKLLFFVPVLLVAAAYFVYTKVSPKKSGAVSSVATSAPSPRQVTPALSSATPQHLDPLADAREYVYRETPRVVGLQHTAPKYDELTKPTRVPVPAACIQVGSLQSEKGASCKCYSQQGTPMNVEISMCMGFARNGYFQEFDPDRDRQQMATAAQSNQVLSGRADAPSTSSNVVSIPHTEPGYRIKGT